MRPRREVLLTTFADPSTFPSVEEVLAESGGTPSTEASDAAQVTPEAAVELTETHEVEVVETPAPAVPTFAELGIPAELVRVLSREGIIAPFEIQAATMPDALAGRDVLGRGQTGSGKTLAFGLPLLTRVARSGRARPLCATRASSGRPNASVLPEPV